MTRRVRRLEDQVLREIARKERDSADRERRDEHRRIRDRQFAAQTAHPVHVLLTLERMHNRAGAEEEQPLEERMRHQVEDSRGKCSHADTYHHVADLAYRRIREHALDIGLDDRDGRREERRERADYRNDLHRVGPTYVKRDLRGLAGSTQEEQQRGSNGDRLQQVGMRLHPDERKRPDSMRRERANYSENSQDETGIADPVGYKRLASVVGEF